MVKPFLSENACSLNFFQLLSTIKEKTVGKMMQSAYLCVILYVEHKKIPFLGVLTWFLKLQVKSKMVAKMATVIGDVTGPQ